MSGRRQPVRTAPSLLLVSASSGTDVREEVSTGLRPCPEYLRLQSLIGADITDWTPTSALRRKSVRAATLAAVSLRRAAGCRSVLSDGEHVGLPLALGMQLLGIRTPHVMLAHRLTTPKKLAVLRHSTVLGRIDRILVHSAVQAEMLSSMVALRPSQLHVVPYGIDTDFWMTDALPDEPLVVSAGREHRDHHVLSSAVSGQDYRVFVTDSSGHSPRAQRLQPTQWPDNVDVGHLTYLELRALYARASVLVVPVVPSDFPAGVTAVLEAMSMGRAVVVTDSPGLRGVVEHGRTGVVVPPHSPEAMRDAIERLLASPSERRRLGAAARAAALERFTLGTYTGRLAGHLDDVAAARS